MRTHRSMYRQYLFVFLLFFCFTAQESFAQRAAIRQTQLAVTVSNVGVTKVSTKDNLRMAELLVNTSNVDIYVSFDTTAVTLTTTGLVLHPGGSYLYGPYTSVGWTGGVVAQASGAAGTLAKQTLWLQ